MDDRGNGESNAVLKKLAVASELARRAYDNLSALIPRIYDREVQQEFRTAENFLFHAMNRLPINIPDEYHADAEMRTILEDIRKMRDRVEEALDHRVKDRVSFIDILPKEIIDHILDIGREADHQLHIVRTKDQRDKSDQKVIILD